MDKPEAGNGKMIDKKQSLTKPFKLFRVTAGKTSEFIQVLFTCKTQQKMHIYQFFLMRSPFFKSWNVFSEIHITITSLLNLNKCLSMSTNSI